MDIIDRLRGKEITHSNTPYAEIAKEAAAEITRLRATIPTEDALDNATSEGYEQGYADGKSEADGAHAELWSRLRGHIEKHGIEIPSENADGSHTANDMMEAVFEREGNLRREIESLRKERDEALEALAPLLSAAQGLRNGTDWNKGTFAITHGYRQALLDAIPAAQRAARPPPPEATK